MLEEVEQRGLFLHRLDDDPQWFRFHQMFAEFLRRRLERDGPERVEQLHRTASAWFADNGYLNEAVDHALAAGDPDRAVDLVEQDETNLLEQSKMTTLLGIVKKLPPQLVVSRAPLQLVIAWANILLQRSVPAAGALNRFEAALGRADLAECDTGGSAGRGGRIASGRRGLRRPSRARGRSARRGDVETGHPASARAGVAGNAAAFAAICRFDFAAVHRVLEWAAPYQEMMGPFATVYGRCFAGMAARYSTRYSRCPAEFRRGIRDRHGSRAPLARCPARGFAAR